MSRVLVPPPQMRAAAPDLIDAAEPVYVAETEAEREAVFSFRYSVYGAELGRKLGNADYGRQRVHDEEDDKPYTILLYTLLNTGDGAGQLTSTARLRRWERGQVPAKDWEAFSMERFDGLREMSTSEIGRLMIEPGRRGQLGLVSIVCAVYQLYAGELPADVGFINCAAGLVRHYRLLGFRTYAGRLVPTADGIEVPLVVIPSDRAYLEQAGSFVAPFADVFYGYGPGQRAPVDVGRWARLLDADSAPVRFDAAAVWERVSGLRQAADDHPSILETLSEDTVQKLSGKGFLMNIPAGQLLTEKGLNQREIFVILDGAFEVHDGDRPLALLGPGEVIGEVGFFGTSGRRMASVTAASDGQVLVLRRRFVDELMRSDPACAAEVLFGLARVLADRQYASLTVSDPELVTLLADIPFFAALDEATRSELAGQLEPVSVAAGQVIFRQGDAGDGLYLVVSGRLRVSVAGDIPGDGPARMLYDLGRGAIVGEMALLTDRPRAATVHAVRDSDLLLLLRVSSFTSLMERSPALVTGIIRLLVDRLLAVDRLLILDRPQAPPPGGHTIAVACAGRDVRAAELVAGQLAAQLTRSGSVFRVDADVVARQLGPNAAQASPGDPGRAELIGWLHGIERTHDRVIYLPDAEDTAWSRLCLSQSDVVLLVASATDDPSLGAVEARALATSSLRCELALLHPADLAPPSAAASWLARRPVADHHHLRADRPGDVARLARMITGTGCGLVLGGGGARGLAHLGVIRALEEAGVPIDVVGGTSIGAIMAALCARGLDDSERVRRVIHIARTGRRLVTPTLPLIAFSAGRRVDQILTEHLTSVPIEDLPLGFFCVSASLTRAEAVIHERGPLWTAVRASLALPGIYPPVYADGDLLIDGGAVDNLPVDVMRDRVGAGSIIAVDVTSETEPLTVAPYGPGLSGWRVLGRRLNPLTPAHPVPGIAEILNRSTGLSQVRHRRAALDDDRVDLVLRPPVARLRTLDFNGGIALIEAGYRYAADALAKSGLANRS